MVPFCANSSLRWLLQSHLGIPAEEKAVIAVVEEVGARRRLCTQILPKKCCLVGVRIYLGFSATKKAKNVETVKSGGANTSIFLQIICSNIVTRIY